MKVNSYQKNPDIFEVHELMRVSDRVGFCQVDGSVDDEDLSVVDRLQDLDVLERRPDVQRHLLDPVLYDPIVWRRKDNYYFFFLVQNVC